MGSEGFCSIGSLSSMGSQGSGFRSGFGENEQPMARGVLNEGGAWWLAFT